MCKENTQGWGKGGIWEAGQEEAIGVVLVTVVVAQAGYRGAPLPWLCVARLILYGFRVPYTYPPKEKTSETQKQRIKYFVHNIALRLCKYI